MLSPQPEKHACFATTKPSHGSGMQSGGTDEFQLLSRSHSPRQECWEQVETPSDPGRGWNTDWPRSEPFQSSLCLRSTQH